MLRRLAKTVGRKAGAGAAPQGAPADPEAEALAALAAWEAAVGGAAPAPSPQGALAAAGAAGPAGSPLSAGAASPVFSIGTDSAADSPCAGDDDSDAESHLARAVGLILSVQRGERRDALVARLGGRLERTMLPGALGDWVQASLALLRDGFSSQELADAIAGSLGALQSDARLERCVADAAACEQTRASVNATAGAPEAGAASAATELAAVLQQAQALAGAASRGSELLARRRAALQAAEATLGAPAAAATAQAAAATAERQRLAEQLERVGQTAGAERVRALEQESVRLEEEVNRLDARKRELKMDLERLGRQHDDAMARQKAHMSQVDCWRLDREKVKETSVRSKEETELAEGAARLDEAWCNELLERIQAIRLGARQATGAAEEAAAGNAGKAEEHLGAAAGGVVRATEARLAAALAAAGDVLAEHRRAKATLQLLEVQAPSADLPTRRGLAASLDVLRDAWAARATLGSVELARRAEVESFLHDAGEEAQGPAGDSPKRCLADAKAAWAKRWGDLGDLAIALADAAAGQAQPRPASACAGDSPGAGAAPPGAPAAAAELEAALPHQRNSLPSLDDDDQPLLG